MTNFSKFHRLVLAVLMLGVSFSAFSQAPANLKIFPLAEVHRGLKGTAYTVFEGVLPEPMEVEILGVLKDSIGPGQDMILARLHGTKPEYTGVVAGMSGSPVYIDGRLLGALSYRIGQFSKEPIAGITPIEQMFEVRDADAGLGAGAGAGTKAPVSANASQNPVPMQAMETPLVFSGFSQEAVERFGDRFRALGMVPVAGLGGVDAEAKQPEPLVPGSAVSAILVRGDISMTGTCTVTYVDATQLLACGHPITQYGAISIPMTKATVVATLPSPLNAFKIINATETVGAFTQDRASAIYGRFGLKAHMIPVSVEVVPANPKDPAVKAKTLRFEVLDNRQLTPSSMLISVYQSLQSTNTSAAEISYRLTGEMTLSTLKGEALPAVKLDAEMAPTDANPAAINAALYVGDRFDRVYGNSVEQPVITGLHLRVEATPTRRTTVLETARLSTMEARPGDTVEIEATLRSYQAATRVVRLKAQVPAGAAAGPMRVIVSDGATLDRLLQPVGAAQHPLGLADAIGQINRIHPNDRLYLSLLEHAPQAVLNGGTLSAVPLSMANVLEPLKDGQELRLTGESAVESSSKELGEALTGSKVLTLLIR